jgi:putative DNA primase/helicase
MNNLVRNWDYVPVLACEKYPTAKGWPTRRFDEAAIERHVARGGNVGVKLGVCSDNLMDIDLDCPEAATLAEHYRIDGGVAVGRSGKPVSHIFYKADETFGTKKFLFAGETLVELRGDGGQTIVPPSIHPSGEALNWLEDPEDGEMVAVSLESLTEYAGHLAAGALLVRHWSTGQRHHLSLALAGTLAKAGWSKEDTERLIQAIALSAGDDDLRDRLGNVHSTYDQLAASNNVVGYSQLITCLPDDVVRQVTNWLGLDNKPIGHNGGPPLGPDVTSGVDLRQWSEMWLSDQFVSNRIGQLLYVKESKSWAAWSGNAWMLDGDLNAAHLAKETFREITSRAANDPNLLVDPRLLRAVQQIEKAQTVDNILKLSRSAMPISIDSFDTDPTKLACPNGIIDLETGRLLPARPDQMVSQLARIPYDPEAEAPEFLSFLETIFDGDDSLIDYVQRAIGYGLTGKTDEQCLFLCHGTGANGKSTLLNLFHRILGDHALTMPLGTLSSARDNGPSNDIARLRGKRLVLATETEQTDALAESLIKSLTGSDPFSARFLYKEYFEFVPSSKIFISTNHLPRIKGSDEGIWRRIKAIPFAKTIPVNERDPKLPEKLYEEAEGVLAWAVRGTLSWLEHGLNAPDVVNDFGAEIRADMDPLYRFVRDEIEFNGTAWTSNTELKGLLDQWCMAQTELVQFSELRSALLAQGAKKQRKQGGRGILGVVPKPRS